MPNPVHHTLSITHSPQHTLNHTLSTTHSSAYTLHHTLSTTHFIMHFHHTLFITYLSSHTLQHKLFIKHFSSHTRHHTLTGFSQSVSLSPPLPSPPQHALNLTSRTESGPVGEGMHRKLVRVWQAGSSRPLLPPPYPLSLAEQRVAQWVRGCAGS